MADGRVAAAGVEAVLSLDEPSAETADFLAAELGLPGNGTRLSEARRDKLAMQEQLRSCGLPSLL